jgi:hypothetical protein
MWPISRAITRRISPTIWHFDTYGIGGFEATVGQYVTFLNTVGTASGSGVIGEVK